MARAGAAATLVLALASAAHALQSSAAFRDSTEREFAIRRWARSGETPEVDQLSSGDRRLAWIAAQERRRLFQYEVGERERDLPLQLSTSELAQQPDLLAAALRAGWAGDADLLGQAARHPLPTVRLAAARAISPRTEAVGLLLALSNDVDERVREAALDALVADSVSSSPVLVALLAQDSWASDSARWRELALRFERCAPDGPVLDGLDVPAATPEQSAVVSALRLRWGITPTQLASDVERVARAWPGPEGFEEIFAATSRALRAPQSELGRALLRELETEEDGARELALLRGAIETLPPREVLAYALAHPEQAREWHEFLFQALELQTQGLEVRDFAAWLARETEAELRRSAVGLLRSLFVDERRPEFGAVLVAALEDADAQVVEAAFEALCDAPSVEPWLDPLYRRWRRFSASRAEALLAQLPRGVRLVPFQADLCGLAELGGAAGTSAFELLAPLAPDAGIAAIARRRLEVELREVARGGSRSAELRAAALVNAIHQHSDGTAQEELANVLRRTRERVEIAKVAAWALGQTERGRALLIPWLAPDSPRRVRVEASLALAPLDNEQAISALAEDWSGCDFELRSRALRAWAASAQPSALGHVQRVARDDGEHDLLRELAVDLLGGWDPPQFDVLATVAADRNLDLRRHALIVLGTCADPRAMAWLRERLHAHDGQLDTPEARAVRELERETIWTVLASTRAVDEELLRSWLAAPLAASEDQLRARFVGRAQGGTEFSWRAELAVAEELARSGRLSTALQVAGPWWTCDARLLLALGERARSHGDLESARQLLVAAGVGLCGEAEGEERDLRLFEVRCALLAVCEALGRFEDFGLIVEQLARAERLGRGPRRAFERVFGGFDPAKGVDGLARLEASLPQWGARRALEQGDRARATALATSARGLVGASRAAAEAQVELEALLGR